MINTRKLVLVAGLALGVWLLATPEARAEKGPYWETSYGAHVSAKLIRGTQNICWAFVEVPNQIILEWQRTDPFTGLWLGFGKGLYHMGRRLTFGVYDLATFPLRLRFDERIDPEVVLLDRID
jgi:putative exosortase-associated protein (TIGR04073 family)